MNIEQELSDKIIQCTMNLLPKFVLPCGFCMRFSKQNTNIQCTWKRSWTCAPWNARESQYFRFIILYYIAVARVVRPLCLICPCLFTHPNWNCCLLSVRTYFYFLIYRTWFRGSTVVLRQVRIITFWNFICSCAFVSALNCSVDFLRVQVTMFAWVAYGWRNVIFWYLDSPQELKNIFSKPL
jgi:hypothetical protein